MSCHRKQRTTQERRIWPGAEDLQREYPQLRLRRRRSFSCLPNAWDDEMVGRCPFRSWKWRRKTQFKTNNA